MSKYYARFTKTYPQIEVEATELPRDALEKSVVAGDIDMVVMLVSNLERMDEIDHELLVRSRGRLWMPADHHLLTMSAITLSDVAAEHYIFLTVDEARTTASCYW